MSIKKQKWTIVGQGLAGTCLAWALWERGEEDFVIVDKGVGGSSRVAAGMVNPVTGKNFEPSWRISEFLPAAMQFYQRVELLLGRKLWYPFPVLRLAASDKEWRKIVSKLEMPEVAPWVVGEEVAPDGWVGAVRLRGGGRLDTRAFVEGSREFFQRLGKYQLGDVSMEAILPGEIRCEGAVGLLTGRLGLSRCAKGEILTVQAFGWNEEQISIGSGGWLVPQGGGLFKVGSTYEWNELDELPTIKGKLRVEEIAARLGGVKFEIIGHDAAVRPILRRSQPLIGPCAVGAWMFNGLGSKGSLYAPRMAELLVDWLVEGREPEPELDFRVFLEHSIGDASL